jgi:hypothetical protein
MSYEWSEKLAEYARPAAASPDVVGYGRPPCPPPVRTERRPGDWPELLLAEQQRQTRLLESILAALGQKTTY